MMEAVNRFQWKHLLAYCLMGLLLCACAGRTQPAFEGTFVQDAQSEFSKASDTLVIEKTDEKHYLIHRRTGIHLLDEAGRPGKLILDSALWQADLDVETGALTERSKGRRLALDGQSLILEHAVYRRVP